MAATRANPRLQVGSQPWIAEERASALQTVDAETEEFTFSARNEVEWLNEHMAGIFNENDINVAEIFKTPGKLRGKTPRTARKVNPLETRAPLTDVFSSTPRGKSSPFKQTFFERPVPTFQVAEDAPCPAADELVVEESPRVYSPIHRKPVPNQKHNVHDSGYFGSQSQSQHATQGDSSGTQATQVNSPPKPHVREVFTVEEDEPVNRESEGSFQSAKEQLAGNLEEVELEAQAEQEVNEMGSEIENWVAVNESVNGLEGTTHPVLESPLQARAQQHSSPQKRSPQKSPQKSPERPISVVQFSPRKIAHPVEPFEEGNCIEDEPMEDVPSPAHSPSEGSSPFRPIVRKSSLNFASLPAREPITTKKSLGARTSRTSNLDHTRTSYYGRATGGKSLGNVRQEEQHKDDDMDIDVDDDLTVGGSDSTMARLHYKTSTQRLQDQISMLGQSQTQTRPASKSIVAGGLSLSQSGQFSQPAAAAQDSKPREKSPRRSPQRSPERSPERKSRPPPGAFPDDEEDSWIGPPTVAQNVTSVFSPRPEMPKSHTTDVMEGIHKSAISGSEFNIAKRGDEQRQASPIRQPVIPERTTSTLGHIKSVSTSVLRSPKKAGESSGLPKTISVSNPNPSSSNEGTSSPPKSPSRSYRGSPLKAAKDKFSSVMKASRSLFVSSAAVSADAKNLALSPPSARYGTGAGPSVEEVLSQSSDKTPLYPILDNEYRTQVDAISNSPPKPVTRKTRASTEREERQKEEEARRQNDEEARQTKEAKEAQRMASQLEKARMKEKEKARVFHQEQERIAAMQKEVDARKENEQQAKTSKIQLQSPRATRSSPRKTKAQLEAEENAAAAASSDDINRDVEMIDASAMPPPSIPRPKSQIGRPGPKRPLRPAKETAGKVKPPTVIRVDTGSQRGHQYHPSNSTLAATLEASLSAPSGPPGLRKKASTSSIQSKASTSSFKATANRAIEAAARKKEQDDLAAQRKRQLKEENDRQRAAIKEEDRRKEEQRVQQEQDRQREVKAEKAKVARAVDAKKAAVKEANEKRRQELERAKQMGAPPPAARHLQDKALPPIPRGEISQQKPARNEPALRQQEQVARPASQAAPNATKLPPKRPLQQDAAEEHSRPAMQRNGPSYEQQSKRRKTSENFDDDDTENQPRMNAPPIRQSSSRPKDIQPKSLFPSGYANAPPSNNLQRSTIISQHNMNHLKSAHPMDMAQVSKGPISFASNPNQPKPQSYKTPMRPGGVKVNPKSVAKSSPHYQNGETIDLPEINTDSEDDDSDNSAKKPSSMVPHWVESPALRKQLTEQENIDPADVFGQSQPLNMEEVFNKSKDKFPKFRDRTSSANWAGVDRLTEDEIKKDIQARQAMQRAGGWEYNAMRHFN